MEELPKGTSKAGAKGNMEAPKDKGKGIEVATRNRDVKCFNCLGRKHYATNCLNRSMIVRDGDTDGDRGTTGI